MEMAAALSEVVVDVVVMTKLLDSFVNLLENVLEGLPNTVEVHFEFWTRKCGDKHLFSL